MPSLTAIDGALRVLNTADPSEKALAAHKLRQDWLQNRKIGAPLNAVPIDPARPETPVLVPPLQVKRRGMGSPQGRGALLHAIAHIELNAIDLAADMIARFSFAEELSDDQRDDFITDWTSVCDDEARHFSLLNKRLGELGMRYGDLPAHNGLWEAARETAHDFTSRLAIAPLVLEARGLDVTPGMIVKLAGVKDFESADILKVIYEEEIGHVAIGAKWFQFSARIVDRNPVELFHERVRLHFKGQIKPPFNVQARTLAGLTEAFYQPLVQN